MIDNRKKTINSRKKFKSLLQELPISKDCLRNSHFEECFSIF